MKEVNIDQNYPGRLTGVMAQGILQAFFTIPLISLSAYLFLRFKKAFSKTSMKNLIKISTLMVFENGLMTILQFFVGVKAFLSQNESRAVALVNLILPVIFGIIWLNMRDIASQRNGFYGAPLSLMNQYEDFKK